MFPNQQDYTTENEGNIFINNPRSRNSLPPSFHSLHNNPNFGPMAINPSHTLHSSFATESSSKWFGTSIDSNGSSFGQSPVFSTRDILVTPSTSTGILDNFVVGDDDDSLQQRGQELFEKRRKRRESHNAVERRRRDNINERIQELSTLLPDHLLESVPASANVLTVTTGQSGTNGKPINKGTILKLSVDHIKELREEAEDCKNRIKELEKLIEVAKKNKNQDEGYKQQMSFIQQFQQPRPKHERTGSIQFQQQFNNLHINNEEQQKV